MNWIELCVSYYLIQTLNVEVLIIKWNKIETVFGIQTKQNKRRIENVRKMNRAKDGMHLKIY